MRFQPGESGNPAGRPRGARNKRTLLAETMLDREGADIIDRLIKLAKGGDIAAIRMCIDRICPRQREQPVSVELPAMTTAEDTIGAMAAIMQAIGDGDLAPQEAAALSKVVADVARTIVAADMERRIAQVEQRVALLSR